MQNCILPGWRPIAGDDHKFIGITARLPRRAPPAGDAVLPASPEALVEWERDEHSAPPEQFEISNMVHLNGERRRRLARAEEEKLMGYPAGYTDFIPKQKDESLMHREFRRQTLLAE